MAEGAREAGHIGGEAKGIGWRSVPAGLVAGLIAALVLAGIAAPVVLSKGATGQDANAKELLVNAVPRMRSCASLEGGGSYAACDAAEMAQTEPAVQWRDGVAPIGWGRGGVGKVYVSDLGETGYRLETTSASGKVFIYAFENGSVARSAIGGGQPGSW